MHLLKITFRSQLNDSEKCYDAMLSENLEYAAVFLL